VEEWCSEQQRGDGIRQSSGSIIGKTAVAASLIRVQWQNCKPKIYPKSNNQPMTMVRTKATSSGSNSSGIASAKSGSSKSSGSSFATLTATAAAN